VILLVHTCSGQTGVPVALHRIAEEDVAENPPGYSAEDQNEEDVAGPNDRTIQRKQADVLEYERGFDKVAGKVVKDRFGEYKL
jgi:hypothetical protein